MVVLRQQLGVDGCYNEELIQDKNSSFFYRCMARMLIRFVIKRSIKIEHHTKEDWENCRKIQKSMGSLVPETDDAIAVLFSAKVKLFLF